MATINPNEIRCLLSSTKLPNTKLPVTVNQYSLRNGKKITECITEMDANKNLGIRNIYKDSTGKIEKVVDNVYGRTETYTQGPNGVMLDNKYEMPFSTLKRLDVTV